MLLKNARFYQIEVFLFICRTLKKANRQDKDKN